MAHRYHGLSITEWQEKLVAMHRRAQRAEAERDAWKLQASLNFSLFRTPIRNLIEVCKTMQGWHDRGRA